METKIKEAAEKWFYEQDQSTERSYTKYDVFEAGYLAAHSQHSESLIKLKEALEHSIKTIEKLAGQRTVRNLDEILADYRFLLKSTQQ